MAKIGIEEAVFAYSYPKIGQVMLEKHRAGAKIQLLIHLSKQDIEEFRVSPIVLQMLMPFKGRCATGIGCF